MAVMERMLPADLRDTRVLVDEVGESMRPLAGRGDLDALMERIGDARYVLIGEASHGTSEFYRWRAEISKRLIAEKGFTFVAVEGDWPDCYRVNRYVKGLPDSGTSAYDVLHAFARWPTWMWANREVMQFAEWLRRHNDALPLDERAGFYGLDVYSLFDSMAAVIRYLEQTDPDLAMTARWAYNCFEPYGEDVQEYAFATRLVPENCEDEVVRVLNELRSAGPPNPPEIGGADGRDAHFNAEQNALVAKNAEHYYRTMARGGAASWNVRDRHMVETLDRLMAHHGPAAKAIFWEHNTHVGDARYTDMARGGMVNVGELAREAHAPDEVVLIGFGSHRGSVIAAKEWEAPMERMPVPEAREGSWEDVLHHAGAGGDALILTDDLEAAGEALDWRGHRAIGVVYHPEYEAFGNYVPTQLPRRYDAFLFIDETEALHPLHVAEVPEREVPETYPVGV